MKHFLFTTLDTQSARKLGSFTFFSGFLKIAWGIWLLIPQWHTFALGQSFAYMSKIGTEESWGIVMVFFGILHVYSYYAENRTLLHTARALSLLIWLFIAASILLSNPAATGVPTYAMIAFVELIIIITRGGNQP